MCSDGSAVPFHQRAKMGKVAGFYPQFNGHSGLGSDVELTVCSKPDGVILPVELKCLSDVSWNKNWRALGNAGSISHEILSVSVQRQPSHLSAWWRNANFCSNDIK